jgi:hypothetical protein
MAAKKFPLGSVRKLAAHVAALHAELQSVLADCDADDGLSNADPKAAPPAHNRAAHDLSDKSEPYAQGQDASVVVAAVRAAIAAERDAPVPMDKAIPGLGRDISHC